MAKTAMTAEIGSSPSGAELPMPPTLPPQSGSPASPGRNGRTNIRDASASLDFQHPRPAGPGHAGDVQGRPTAVGAGPQGNTAGAHPNRCDIDA